MDEVTRNIRQQSCAGDQGVAIIGIGIGIGIGIEIVASGEQPDPGFDAEELRQSDVASKLDSFASIRLQGI